MSQLKIMTQRIAERKTLILHSMLDYGDARFRVESIKTTFFAGQIFSKPKFKDISFLTSNKFYEPYFVIGGKYSLDYRKKNMYTFKVNNQFQKVHIGEEEFKSAIMPSDRLSKTAGIMGKECVHCENETYVVLDRMMREVSYEELPMAPFAVEMEDSLESNLDLRKAKIPPESEIAFLRSKLVKIPSEALEVVRQNFEITQRLLVYKPVYEFTFENAKSGEVATALVDGTTGKVLVERVLDANSGKLARYFNKSSFTPPSAEKRHKNEAKSSMFALIPEASNKIIDNTRQNSAIEKYPASLKLQLALGCLSLIVGLLAANLALFGWSTPADSFRLLGEYARYACAYGGFGAIIFGSMMINDFIILRLRGLKGQSYTIALERVESDKEQVHFVFSELEEGKESVSEVSSRQK